MLCIFSRVLLIKMDALLKKVTYDEFVTELNFDDIKVKNKVKEAIKENEEAEIRPTRKYGIRPKRNIISKIIKD